VSLGQLSATSTLSPNEATLALALAFAANSLVKCIAAFGAGGIAFARPLACGIVAINAALLATLALSH
jgi:hypothetical protein